MPNPRASDLHVDQLATNFSVGYVQSQENFQADKVFPLLSVARQTGVYAKYNRHDFWRDEVQERAPGTESGRTGYRVDNSNTYHCREYSLEFALDDTVRANADAPYNPEQEAVMLLTGKMLLRREKDFCSAYLSTVETWDGSSDGSHLISGTDFTAWSNAASDPINDIKRRQVMIEQRTGFLPNKLVFGNRQIWHDFENHPDIVDRVKHVSNQPVTKDIVARLIGVDEILIMAGLESTRAENTGTSTQAGRYIGGDNALLVYTPSAAGLMSPTGGYTFTWNGLLPGANLGQVVERYREDRVTSDIFRIRATWDHVLIDPNCGVLFENCSTRI